MERAFSHGFILALGLILPLGVQNLFILQQGLAQKSFGKVLPAVITAALCDTLVIICAVSGVSMLLAELPGLRLGLLLCGVAFLLYMGWSNWRAEPQAALQRSGGCLSVRQQVVFAASVSLLNPYAFLDILGVIGTSSMQYEGLEKYAFVGAAILVSWLWFTGLGSLGVLCKDLPVFNGQSRLLTRGSAFFIWGTAFYLMSLL